MPRRRSFLERPHAHLAQAAARHAARAAGVPHETELAGEAEQEHAPTPRQAAAARQSRTQGGKFK